MLKNNFSNHYMCPSFLIGAEKIPDNEENVECFLYFSDGIIVAQPVNSKYEKTFYKTDKFEFYVEAGYIKEIFK